MRQVLLNLMSNAVKYTPSGGSVCLSAEIVGDKAHIAVRDTGVGITEDEQKRLFQRFERGDDNYSKSQTGTGLGLSLTKHLTEINGGKISVSSKKGEGSTFSVLIPLADNDALAEEAHAGEGAELAVLNRLEGLNILIVDDNKLTCDVLETIITQSGGHAYVALDVPQARKIAESTDLDAALVDLAIPGEDGLSFIRWIRQTSSSLSLLPVIVVSACVFDRDRELAKEAGASFFIAKPFKPAEVVRSIRHFTLSSVLDSGVHFRVVT